jgi:hypothetical protein
MIAETRMISTWLLGQSAAFENWSRAWDKRFFVEEIRGMKAGDTGDEEERMKDKSGRMNDGRTN